MIKFNVKIEQFLNDLRRESGKDIFNNVKQRGDDYQCSCPFHKDIKPSFGINKDGIWHCFSCGEKGNAIQLVQKILDIDNYKIAEKWIEDKYYKFILETPTIPTLDFTLKEENKIEVPKKQYIPKEELNKYKFYHPYMYERKLTNQIIQMFDIGYDKDFILEKKDPNGNIKYDHFGPAITFPVKDINGNILFIARRCINNKIFHYPDGAEKPLYGVYELFKYHKDVKQIWVCESILDSLYLWTQNRVAVALNGLGSSEQYRELESLGIKEMILALDNDKAGEIGTRGIIDNVKNVYFRRAILPENRKDINECTEEEIKNLKIV